MTLADMPILVTCDLTGRTQATTANADGSPKLPRGWKRLGNQTLSPQAMKQQYVTRSMRLPIASVALESAPDGGWKAFRADLKAAWGDATRYANLGLSQYAAKDFALPLVKNGEGKLSLPKVEQQTQNAWRREVYALHHDFAALDATSAAAISTPGKNGAGMCG